MVSFREESPIIKELTKEPWGLFPVTFLGFIQEAIHDLAHDEPPLSIVGQDVVNSMPFATPQQ